MLNQDYMQNAIFMKVAPHVHVHYWMTDKEYVKQGYVDTEMCCHACHESLTIRYDLQSSVPKDGFPLLHNLMNQFTKNHQGCRSSVVYIPYESFCPLVRYDPRIIDVRGFSLFTGISNSVSIDDLWELSQNKKDNKIKSDNYV